MWCKDVLESAVFDTDLYPMNEVGRAVMFEFVQRKGKEVKSEIIVEFSASKKCVDKLLEPHRELLPSPVLPGVRELNVRVRESLQELIGVRTSCKPRINLRPSDTCTKYVHPEYDLRSCSRCSSWRCKVSGVDKR
jgi:hypothetical protein